MRQFALLATVLACAGCLTPQGLMDWPVHDRDKVRQAIDPVVKASLDHHAKAGCSANDPPGYFGGHSAGNGEAYWGVTFTYRAPGGAARDVSPEEGHQILTGVRADVLAAVEKTGVSVTWAPAPGVGVGPNPDGKFEIRYLRKLRDARGEVAGEIVGKLIPIKGGEPMSQVRITFNEWPCK